MTYGNKVCTIWLKTHESDHGKVTNQIQREIYGFFKTKGKSTSIFSNISHCRIFKEIAPYHTVTYLTNLLHWSLHCSVTPSPAPSCHSTYFISMFLPYMYFHFLFLPIETCCVLSAPLCPGLFHTVLFRPFLSLPITYRCVAINYVPFHADMVHCLPSHSKLYLHIVIHSVHSRTNLIC